MSGNAKPKRAYSFKGGLTMLAAKDVGVDPYLAADAGEDARVVLAALRRAKATKGKDKANHIAAAQAELRRLNHKRHGKLVASLQARVLALQGRGRDTAVAHLEPGEMVIPRRVLTAELAQIVAAEAARRGIDPRQLIVGGDGASINPATGAEEFGWFSEAVDRVKSWFSNEQSDKIDPIVVSATRKLDPYDRVYSSTGLDIESIPVTGYQASIYGPPRIGNPTGGVERNDGAGSGWYGASRGNRKHFGVDITVAENSQDIFSPIEGTIVKRGQVYSDPDKSQYKSVWIEGTGPHKGLTTKLYYVDGEGPSEHETVVPGQKLGRAQNRHLTDPSGKMLNHVHLETIWGGQNVDPVGFLPNWRTQAPKRQ